MPGILHDPVTGEAFRYWTRAEWGARGPKAVNRLTSTREGIFYHHTVTPAGPNVPAILRGIQAHHMNGNGWLDIAYSFAVGLAGEYDGDLFELRGFGVQGGHTENMNSHSHAISFVGDTRRDHLSPRARRAALAIAREIERRLGGNRVRCHGDVTSTDCPGAEARSWVHSGRPTDTPTSAPTPAPAEDDMINWRPVHCPEFGDAQWLLTFDGDGRPRRLFLGAGDPQLYWALGYIQTIDPIIWTGAEATRFMAIPEATPEPPAPPVDVDEAAIVSGLRQPLVDAVTAVLQAQNIDVDEAAVAEAVADELHTRLTG